MQFCTVETNTMLYINCISIFKNGNVERKGEFKKKFSVGLNSTFLKGTIFSYFSSNPILAILP